MSHILLIFESYKFTQNWFETYPGLVPYLSTTCLGLVQDLSRICPRLVQDLSRTCPRAVPDLSRTCPRPVPDLSQTFPRTVKDLSQTCPWPVPDLSRTSPGHIRTKHFLTDEAYELISNQKHLLIWNKHVNPFLSQILMIKCCFTCTHFVQWLFATFIGFKKDNG